MVKFNEDEDLGKVISKKQLFSFGAAPLKNLKELVFAAGGDKFSSLCGFRFESKADTEYKEFFIAFVCKLRSKIYHQASTNPSQWFIFKKISGKEMHCLAKDDLRNQYGFDIKKFFDSDYFQQSLVKFKKTIDKGIKTYVPDYVKAHGMEKAKDYLTSYEIPNDMLVKDTVGRYVKAISESLEYIDQPIVNDKFYKLIDYDVKVESENVDEAYLPAQSDKFMTVGGIQKALRQFDSSMRVILANDAADKFIITNMDVVPTDRNGDIVAVDIDEIQFDSEKEMNESDIVAEASKWDCEVEEEDGKFNIYEKADHFWVASFYDQKAAENFAKNWPKMKEQYIKQQGEAEAKKEMVEKEDELSEEQIKEKELDDKIEEALSEIYK